MAPLTPVQIKALVRAGLKSLKQTLVIVSVSVLLWRMSPTLALLWGIASSGYFLLRSYGREWRLTALTCLLPAACSIGCFIFQAALLPAARWQGFLGPGLLTGLALGFISGRGHKVFVKDNQVFGRRTFFYLLAWFATTTATQGFALFNLKDLVGLGLTGGIFSTAMLTAVSMTLFRKYALARRQIGRPADPVRPALLVLAIMLTAVAARSQSSSSGITQVLTAADIPGYTAASVSSESMLAVPSGQMASAVGLTSPENVDDPAYAAYFTHPAAYSDRTDWVKAVLLRFPDAASALAFGRFYQNSWRSTESIPNVGMVVTAIAGCGDMAAIGSSGGVAGAVVVCGRWLLLVSSDMNVDSPAPSSGSFDFNQGIIVRQQQDLRARQQELLTGLLQTCSPRVCALPAPRRSGRAAPVVPGKRSPVKPARVVPSDPQAVAGMAVILLLILSLLGVNITNTLGDALFDELTRIDVPPAEPVSGPSTPRSPHRPTPPPKPSAPDMTPLLDPESGKDLVIQDGRYEGGRLGQVWYQGRWMDRAAAEAAIALWEAEYQADRRQWFDAHTSAWERGVQEKIERDNMEIDPYTGAWRKPLENDASEIVIPPESGDASRDDIDFGLTGVEISHETTEARFNELAGLKEKALEHCDDARRKYQDALESGDQWLAGKYKERLDLAQANVDAVQSAADNLQKRVDQRARQKLNFQEGIDNVSPFDVGRELYHLPYQMIESWKDDPGFVETMKGAIAARNKLQGIMNEAPELYGRHESALSRLHGLKQEIDAARASGDKGLEARLRAQAEPIKAELRGIQDDLNQIHNTKQQWERRASQANLAAYLKATDMVVTGTQSAEMGATVNGVIDWYRGRSIPGKTMGDSGWTVVDKRSVKEMELDAEHFQGVQKATQKYDAWAQAYNRKDQKKATIDMLDDYQAKVQMKSKYAHVQDRWAENVVEYRDKPLFNGLAEECKSRGWVTNDNGVLRPVKADDFGKVTSSRTGAPGNDLDIKYANIIDPKTKKPVGFAELQGAADKTCARLGFDPVKQEIKVVGGARGSAHPEALSIKPGATADTMYSPGHLGRYDNYDGEQAYRVTRVKADESLHLSQADRTAEACRTSVKDYERVSKTLMGTREGAVAKPPFSDKAIKIMNDVGTGALPPGTGNRQFRELTGMDLAQGCEKLDSLQETLIKLDPSVKPTSREIMAGTGMTLKEKIHRAETFADGAYRGNAPPLSDREVPGAVGWPQDLLDGQKWPESLGTVKQGTLKVTSEGGEAWWPKDELDIPLRSITAEKWKLEGKFVTEEQRWIMRDRELGLRPAASEPVELGQILGTKRPPELEAFAAANPDFKRLDDTVRAAWKEAGGGMDEDSWANMQGALESRGIDERLFGVWQKGATEGSWGPSSGVASVVVPGEGRRFAGGAADFGTIKG